MSNIINALILGILLVGNLFTVIGTQIIKRSIENTGVTSSGITSLWVNMTGGLSNILNNIFATIFFPRNIYIFILILLFICFGFFYGIIIYFKPKKSLIYMTIGLLLILLIFGLLAVIGPIFFTGNVTKNF